jgi:putative transcription factor
MNCELCGRAITRYHEVIIDGVVMKVCDDCAKYGKEIKKKVVTIRSEQPIRQPQKQGIMNNQFVPSPSPKRKPSLNVDDSEEPVENFGMMIKKKREEMRLSQEELALKLQEKKNLIAKIEREEIKPDRQTARKIEKLMGIKIIEKVT